MPNSLFRSIFGSVISVKNNKYQVCLIVDRRVEGRPLCPNSTPCVIHPHIGNRIVVSVRVSADHHKLLIADGDCAAETKTRRWNGGSILPLIATGRQEFGVAVVGLPAEDIRAGGQHHHRVEISLLPVKVVLSTP